ncbi:MAG: xanthine dehydrogenase family protein molybdopterin-binding subunit [Gammaproteobacteria bacterium]|nr:xanthine dehydrogenase family protein molybdopterin-binding subunit [Gammaproteobacteria bacterium]
MAAKPEQQLSIIGRRQPRVDGFDKVTGRSEFTDDIRLPGMLYGKILRSSQPHARIARIDTSRAEALPRVKAVVTNRDAPDLMFSEHQHVLAQDVVRYVGEEVAAVAAVDLLTAEEALELIEVEYEPLPNVTTVRQALKNDAPCLHERAPGNIGPTMDQDWGDPDRGFAESDRIIEDEFRTPMQHNTLAELHVALADFSNPEKLHLYTPTQGAPLYQMELARGFGLAESQVRIVYRNIGGAFTGRGRPKPHHFVAALLSRKAGRPVKIKATADEEFIMFRASGETLYKFRTGVTHDGTIKALEADITFDAGGHDEWAMILWLPSIYLNWLYKPVGVRYKGRFVFTNTVPKGSHHGGIMGRMSAGWQQHITRVAEVLGMDPAELQLKNAVDPGYESPDGSVFASCGLKECIETVVERSDWRNKHGKLPKYRGIGIGIGAQASGSKGADNDTSAAMVKIAADGVVTLYTGIPDMGQGSHTVMCMIAAEVLGTEPEKIRVVQGDSDITPFDWGAFAQRGTFTTGNAVKAACEDAREQLAVIAGRELDEDPASLMFRHGRVQSASDPDKVMSFGEVAAKTLHSVEGRFVMGRGFFNSPKPFGALAFSFGAQIAEVEVDPETGAVAVLKVWAAHDIGRAINRLAVEGQLDGQVFSGMSQVLYEECKVEDGLILNPSRLEYKLPRTYELPAVDYSLVETIDPYGPFGAKEVGEGPIVVSMSAVAAAVQNAVGALVPEIPMTPWRIKRMLRATADGSTDVGKHWSEGLE